jgi:hypothetical protein
MFSGNAFTYLLFLFPGPNIVEFWQIPGAIFTVLVVNDVLRFSCLAFSLENIK